MSLEREQHLTSYAGKLQANIQWRSSPDARAIASYRPGLGFRGSASILDASTAEIYPYQRLKPSLSK
jgi:hypothetical protein